ncbi:hypothetical protein H4582DRAFT_1825324 [Lactarius indigo]|nr:hypothetical protein H4582DRAFT_1825324 [Lactarius indigo]
MYVLTIVECHREHVDDETSEKSLINEHTTLRRHAAAIHSRRYRKWCQDNNFESMLPEDTKRRREAAANKLLRSQQSAVTDHFRPEDPSTRRIPYSDSAFQTAAIEWLVQTNQPVQAFKHPSYKKMLDIASRANRDIKLLSQKQTRARIIKMFKQQMIMLKGHLNVSVPAYTSVLHTHTHTLEPCCERADQPDM